MNICSKALMREAGGAARAGATPRHCCRPESSRCHPHSCDSCDYRRVKTLVPTLGGHRGGNVREGRDTVQTHTQLCISTPHLRLGRTPGVGLFLVLYPCTKQSSEPCQRALLSCTFKTDIKPAFTNTCESGSVSNLSHSLVISPSP